MIVIIHVIKYIYDGKNVLHRQVSLSYMYPADAMYPFPARPCSIYSPETE